MPTSRSTGSNARRPVQDPRSVDARDKEMGVKVRTRRLECSMSQTTLAEKIGVTFQQVQKYEKGTNRIGASRLQRIADALEVEAAYFYPSKGGQTNVNNLLGLVSTAGSMRLLKAYHAIPDREARQGLVKMAESIAKNVD